MGWMTGVQLPAGAGTFPLCHRFRTGCGAHPVSYVMGTGSSFFGDKAAEAWNWPLTFISFKG